MSAEQRHTVLVISGFQANDEQTDYLRKKTDWSTQGLPSLVVPVIWEEGTFRGKLHDLTDNIDVALEQENKVSLLGVSAGGVLAVAGLIVRPKVHKAVTISSRLRSKKVQGFTEIEHIRAISPSLVEAVEWLEAHDSDLTPEMRKRIMNTRAWKGDTQVHPSMSFIEGAENVWMPPARSHIRAVSDALTVHSEVIVDFLKKN